jgi:outer membrane protein assembly factor BamB
MRTKFALIYFLIGLVYELQAQITIVLDNDQPNCTIQGSWLTKTHTDCYNGNARYIKRGKGDNYINWNQPLTFPGKYQIETYLINYKYAKDAHVYVKTQAGDSLVLVDQYYEPKGWKTIGEFDLPQDFYLKVTDLFESDSGTYVYADAFRLTYLGQLFNIEGTINTSLFDTTTIIQATLLTGDTSAVLMQYSLVPNNRAFAISNVPAGIYVLRFTAWGYDTLYVGNLDLHSGDLTGLNYTLQPLQINRYTLSGTIWLDDSSSTSICRVELIPSGSSLSIGYCLVGHNQRFVFDNIPTGHYRLKITAKGYLPDSTSFTDILLNQNLDLGIIRMYAFFQFAWYTDIHIGAGTESGFQTVINNINARQAELDFAFATGDLTEKGLNSEFNTYKSFASTIKIPVYNIPGNHDTKWSESGIQGYQTIIGPLCFSFNHKGYHFIGFNSGNYLKGGYGYFDPAHIAWLEEDLANLPNPDMPVIFATHYPLDIGGVPNYWRVLDILKKYHTVFIMVGHGHSNVSYDFEGLPGAMSMDTYHTTAPSGFNIVTVSKKEIALTTVLNSTGTGETWYRQPFIATIQPQIEFTNLAPENVITEPKVIQISVSMSMVSGTYQIRPEMSGTAALAGSGKDWSLNLDPANYDNGNHTLTVRFNSSTGKQFTRTIQFYIENGNYPKSVWRFQAQATIIGTPVYDAKGVYFGSSDNKIHGISLTDGTPLWEPFKTAGMVLSSGCIIDTILYIGSSDRKIYGISTNSGKECWSYSTAGAVIAPVVSQDSILYFAGNNILYAFNHRTHQKLWEYTTGGLIESRPAIQDEKIIITSWDRYVHCLNRFTGSVIWRFNRQSSFYYAPAAGWPVISHDKVFIVDPARYLTAINLANGSRIWESNTPECWESIGISCDKSRVYVRSLDGRLYAFSTTGTTQQQIWVANADYGWDSTPSMPIEKNGAVFTGGKKGFVISVEGINGRIKWKYWAAQDLVGTVTPIDGVNVLACALDGSVTLITHDPALIATDGAPSNIPIQNALLPIYPNPFNSTARIAFTLEQPQKVAIYIYDLLGRCVREWQYYAATPGYHYLTWNGQDASGSSLPSGVYLVRIEGTAFNATRKLLLLK